MTPGSGTVVDARTSLALWLRDGRARKRLSLDDVARITKIQPRILEKLERGELDGLPAEVFVKGFVRSFARCVGLDETEALDRYTACRNEPPRANDSGPVARALVATMAELAPETARQESLQQPIEVVEIIEVGPIHSEVAIQPPLEIGNSGTELPVVDISLTDMPVLGESNPALPVAETAATETPAPVKKKRTRKKPVTSEAAADGEAKPKRTRTPRKKKVALGTPPEATPIVAAPNDADALATEPPASAAALATEPPASAAASPASAAASPASESEAQPAMTVAVESSDATISAPPGESVVDAAVSAEGSGRHAVTHGTWKPTMPPLAATPSVPWRRPNLPAATLPVTPSLVIDDADPDRAEREQDERAAAREPHRVSFLPPILLDREDRSARQGGLTLAVIILLIAATLTLSYLMRRPSVSGDGVTMRETPASLA
jgi:hypothetical protein